MLENRPRLIRPCAILLPWWRHQMETLSALLAICAGNSPAQRPVTRSFDVFFDLCRNKLLSKQSWGWWFETLSSPLWRHCNDKYCSYCLTILDHTRSFSYAKHMNTMYTDNLRHLVLSTGLHWPSMVNFRSDQFVITLIFTVKFLIQVAR